MKTILIVLSMLLTPLLLTAGGNVKRNLSKVVSVPSINLSKTNLTYVDSKARLMWQDQPYTEAEYGAYKRNYSLGKVGTHSHAIRYCEHLYYAGFSDWRLPTSDELMSVHKQSGNAFRFSQDNDFWTTTPSIRNKYYVVFPADAYRYPRAVQQTNFIRCVRSLAQ